MAKIKFARKHKYWTVEGLKKVSKSDKPNFTLKKVTKRERKWRKKSEAEKLDCLKFMFESVANESSLVVSIQGNRNDFALMKDNASILQTNQQWIGSVTSPDLNPIKKLWKKMKKQLKIKVHWLDGGDNHDFFY
ncbi:hypothetical protein BJ944DRAFT_235924 [Cunninghamella echinulata]|nr:hypothetical protein BJ944DRAFT_235924 [Cunninghamella echinulata]